MRFGGFEFDRSLTHIQSSIFKGRNAVEGDIQAVRPEGGRWGGVARDPSRREEGRCDKAARILPPAAADELGGVVIEGIKGGALEMDDSVTATRATLHTHTQREERPHAEGERGTWKVWEMWEVWEMWGDVGR